MKIVKLSAENIKRLVAVEITPKGNVVKITGKNANGKTSVLDAIWMALGGKDAIPDKPIREGEESGTIEIELDDLIVKRRFTEKGTTVTVTNKDGATFSSPQAMLDDLIGRLSLDPMRFIQLKPVEQFRTLAEYSGVDFTAIDAKRKVAFDERTNVNRDGKAKAAEVAAIEYDENAPDEIVSVSDLIAELDEANKKNADVNAIDGVIGRAFEDIKATENQIKELTEKLDEIKKSHARSEEKRKGMKFIKTSAIQEKINNAETNNNAARAKQAFNTENEKLIAMRGDSAKLSEKINECDEEKSKMIADAKLPVVGLGFGDGFVTYNDIPLDQASSAEQLKVSVSIAMAMNPKLRVIRIQDGSLLDSDSMKMLETMADDKEFQFWVEQVDESGKVGVVIEDGCVVSDNQ